MGAAAASGWDFSERFYLAAIIMFLAFLVTWFASKKTGRTHRRKRRRWPASDAAEAPKQAKPTGLRTVLVSTFGMYLLVLILSSVANNGVNNQISNILPNVYGVSEVTVSGLISLAGLLNILVFFIAGAWMGRSGPMPVFTAGNVARFLGALGMAVLGMVANSPYCS